MHSLLNLHNKSSVLLASIMTAIFAQSAQASDSMAEAQADYHKQQMAEGMLPVPPSPDMFFECTQVTTATARLACYDKVAESANVPSFVGDKKPIDLGKTFQSAIKGKPELVLDGEVPEYELVDGTTDTTDTDVEIENQTESNKQLLSQVGVTQDEIDKYTPLSLAYDLDKNSEVGKWKLRAHNPMYILPVFVHDNPNRTPSTATRAEANLGQQYKAPELKYQLSMKTKVAEDLFDGNADVWFGYTQQSHWQIYNPDHSEQFRATDYMPELFITQPVKADLPFGGRLRMLGAGVKHHSNGEDDPLSRSWNRMYMMAGAEWET